MEKTTVTHVYGPTAWNVYVGRPTPRWEPTGKHPLPDWFTAEHRWMVKHGHPLANPFVINDRMFTREESLKRYASWLNSLPRIDETLFQLRGKVLACWCKAAPPYTKHKTDMPCHADVLAAMANDLKEEL